MFEPGKKTELADVKSQSTEQEEKRSKRFEILADAVRTGCTLIVCWVLLKIVFTLNYIPTGSMSPTIEPGSFAVGWRLSYLIADPLPDYGDIVCFQEKEGEPLLIKRVIGLPGDEIRIESGFVLRNGERLEEIYVKESEITEPGKSTVYKVPDGCIFVMGDNRMNSRDSRYWEDPYVSADNIFAKHLFHFQLPGFA